MTAPIALPIIGRDVVVDRLVPEDAAALAAYRSDPEVARYQGWSAPYGTDAAARLIADTATVAPFAAGTGAQLALRARAGGPLLGDIYVEVSRSSPWACELGITLARAAQGRGVATAAITAVLDAGFGPAVRLQKAIAYVDVHNTPSQRLFERLGFRREGHLSESFRGPNGARDEILYGQTATRWRTGGSESLVIESDPHPADVAALDDGLYEFNVEATGFDDGVALAAFVRDEHGRLVGGIAGHTWGGVCEIRTLWVAHERRRQGLGSRLLAAAEAEARRRGCEGVFLNTHSFQAPTFYRRAGYVVTGTWEDFPRGHRQVFLHKHL